MRDQRHWPQFLRIARITALTALIVNCGADKAPEPAVDGSTEASTPSVAGMEAVYQAINAPKRIEVTPERKALGKDLFETNCVGCHGIEGAGRVGIGPRLNSKTFLEAASDAMLFTTIHQGRDGTTMNPWSAGLKREDIKALVAYIRTLQDHQEISLDNTPSKGDHMNGEKLFSSICARCHGRSGAGYQESSSGTGIARKAFLNTVSNGYLRHIIKNGKSQTKMRGFADEPTAVVDLSDQEIEDVIAYLRKISW